MAPNSAVTVSILLCFKGQDTFICENVACIISRKNQYPNGTIVDEKDALLPLQKIIGFIFLYIPKFHVSKKFLENNKRLGCSNKDIIILGPSKWKTIISETIHSILCSPGSDTNLRILCQSVLKLHLSPSDALMSAKKRAKKVNTKGSAPEENDKHLVADSVNLIFVVLGWSGEKPAESIEVFNVITQKWSFFQRETRFMRAYHGVALLGSYLYIIGGFNGHTCLATTLCLNTHSREWSRKAPMSIPRCYLFTLTCRGYIYAIGGHNGDNRLKTCEKFDPRANRWVRISDMMYRRSDAAGVELNGMIYVSGGFDGFHFHSTTEMYNPQHNEWTLIGSLLRPRSGHCMANLDGHLFVLGGFNGFERLRQVEKFNEETNQWEGSVPMLIGRSNFACVVFEQQIYVIGGYDGYCTIANVEKFNESQMEWQTAPNLNVHRSATGACVSNNSANVSACALNEWVPVVSTDIEEPSP